MVLILSPFLTSYMYIVLDTSHRSLLLTCFTLFLLLLWNYLNESMFPSTLWIICHIYSRQPHLSTSVSLHLSHVMSSFSVNCSSVPRCLTSGLKPNSVTNPSDLRLLSSLLSSQTFYSFSLFFQLWFHAVDYLSASGHILMYCIVSRVSLMVLCLMVFIQLHLYFKKCSQSWICGKQLAYFLFIVSDIASVLQYCWLNDRKYIWLQHLSRWIIYLTCSKLRERLS